MRLCPGNGAALLTIYATLLAITGNVHATEDTPLQISQGALGKVVRDATLIDRQGRSHRLLELIDRPVVISMVYTACVHSCSVTTRHLDDIVRKARSSLGSDTFRVLTVGFDVGVDSPEAMAEYARRYRVQETDWYFLSIPDEASRDRLAEDLGFVYQPSPRGYDHTVQATVVDATAQVYRQVYGEVFDTPLLVEPLKELILGRPAVNEHVFAELGRRIRWFCTVYDARSDRYYFDYSMFMGLVIGALVIGGVVGWLGLEVRARRVGGRA